MSKLSKSWYKDGLNFSCHRCGYCCTFPGGYVWVSVEEIQAMAVAVNMDLQVFSQKYIRKYKDKYSLIEKSNGHCVMYKNGGCSVYQARPKQCQTFPFWPEVCESEATWAEQSKTCQGVNQGQKISADEITTILSSSGETF